MVKEWNTQFGVSNPVSLGFYSPDDDDEPVDPDGGAGTLTFSNGKAMGNQAGVGDGKTVLQEYRGYILDGGGFDWNGTHNITGGHTHLSPVTKDFLVEVDAMASITNLPVGGLKTWMNPISRAMSQAVDGAGIRMYYVLDDLATPVVTFSSQADLRAYDTGNINANLPSPIFKHLQLVSRFGAALPSTSGLAWNDVGANYAVDSGFDFATYFGIASDTSAEAYISHELAHTIINQVGDDMGEHFNDTNGDGKPGDADDPTRVSWNYNYAYPAKTLTVALTATSATITLNNTTNMTSMGLIDIGGEWITYNGIVGNTLTIVMRGWGGTAAASHSVGDAVTPRYYALEMRQIRYGYGIVRYMDVR